MFGKKIRLSKTLLENCKKHAAAVGYSSVEEFIIHTLEKETRKTAAGPGHELDDEILTKRLRGLGYVE